MLAPEPTSASLGAQELKVRQQRSPEQAAYKLHMDEDSPTVAKAKESKDSSQIDVHTPLSVLPHGEVKGPPQACLFVASLSPDTPEDVLHDFFTRYGEVLKIKLMKDRSSRPYAFVQYANAEDANIALQQANGATLDGRRLRVEKAKVNRTLFVAKMNRNLTTQKLRETAEAYGPVESVTIIKNHQTQKSKGCGFIKYVFREDAMDAYLGLKNQFRKWAIEWATSSNDPDALGVDKCNIFVGGLNPKLVTKADIENRFECYGQIENVTLINRDEHQPDASLRSAFAFIRFHDAASSTTAIEQENGTEWLGRRIRVQYCESMEMKSKRRTQKYFSAAINPYFLLPGNSYYPGLPYPAPAMMAGTVPMYPSLQHHTMSSNPHAVGVDPTDLYYERKAYSATEMQHYYASSFPENVYTFTPTMPPYAIQPWAYDPRDAQDFDDRNLGPRDGEQFDASVQVQQGSGLALAGESQNGLTTSFGALALEDPSHVEWQEQ